ncbi:MAG: tripartite tricarboxylate transporter TctB family protein [Candidatus Binatia bacterium]
MIELNTPSRRAWMGFVFWVGLASTALALTFGFEGEIANYRYGPAGWPRALFISIIFISLVQLFFSLRRAKSPECASPTVDDDGPFSLCGLPVKTIAVPVLYISLLTPVGFFVATPFFLAGVMLMMGERRWIHILAVTGMIYGLIILVFIKLLYVPLPLGTLPVFYDIGNFLLVAIR